MEETDAERQVRLIKEIMGKDKEKKKKTEKPKPVDNEKDEDEDENDKLLEVTDELNNIEDAEEMGLFENTEE